MAAASPVMMQMHDRELGCELISQRLDTSGDAWKMSGGTGRSLTASIAAARRSRHGDDVGRSWDRATEAWQVAGCAAKPFLDLEHAS